MEESKSFSKAPVYCHWVFVIFICLFLCLFIFSVNKFLSTTVIKTSCNLRHLKFFLHAEAVPQRCSPGGGCSAHVLRILGRICAWVWFQLSCKADLFEIALLHCCSPVGLLHVSGASFLENTSKGLPLNKDNFIYDLFIYSF